jgi:L-amino acid N-acyltransferase YncA
MDLQIRKAQPDDAEAIVAILNPIIDAGRYSVLDAPLTAELEQQYIAGFSPRGVFHVAELGRDCRVVGLQSLEPFATYTHAFDHVAVMGTFVALPHQRQGVGTCLSAVTFEAARGPGYEKIFTCVRADNLASLAFHLKLGFRIVGTAQRQAQIGGRYVDEIIIEMLL